MKITERKPLQTPLLFEFHDSTIVETLDRWEGNSIVSEKLLITTHRCVLWTLEREALSLHGLEIHLHRVRNNLFYGALRLAIR
jgi:hypothetical protein